MSETRGITLHRVKGSPGSLPQGMKDITFPPASPPEYCDNCKGQGYIEIDGGDGPDSTRECGPCCGTGLKDHCPPECRQCGDELGEVEVRGGVTICERCDRGRLSPNNVMALIDTLRHDIIAILYAWIEDAKHPTDGSDAPRGADIPASFFQLLHCEQDANKLAFALENMRRHLVREAADEQTREGS